MSIQKDKYNRIILIRSYTYTRILILNYTYDCPELIKLLRFYVYVYKRLKYVFFYCKQNKNEYVFGFN